ncbi:MAG: glutamate racemase [Smithellaceae bacterium]|nr:glutamate racemase [Smithellaceae bacterium]
MLDTSIKPVGPIGIFDSGIGGLTVVKALIALLPREDLIYVGDTARVPYGVKSPETISRYAGEIVEFLLGQGVKMLIVACNSMSAVALNHLSALTQVPLIDVIEAGAACALGQTRNNRIGIIGTPATINSGAYQAAIGILNRNGEIISIFSRACPLFVPLVEEGWLNHRVTRLTAEEYLAPLLAEDIDVLILGCTHYPLLKPLLQDIAGPGVTLIDSARAVAERARAHMQEWNISTPASGKPRRDFFVTDAPDHFRLVGEAFLGRELPQVRVISL